MSVIARPAPAAGRRRRMPRRRGGVLVAAGMALAATVSGCAASADGPNAALSQVAAPVATASASAAPAASSGAAPTCSPAAQASYSPLGSLPAPTALPAGSLEATIRARGQLVVGVSGDTRLLGARNSLNGGALEGFDIDMARMVAGAIFGTQGPIDDHIQYKVITNAQRFPLVNQGVAAGGVDLVARAVSMTCDRWSNPDPAKGASFSAGYFKSEQRILVRSDSTANSIADLAKVNAKVCAPSASTSLTNIQRIAGVDAVAVAINSDCLALWQEGKVDAITDDDAILAGFKAQDPHAVIRGGSIDSTYYALAIGRTHREFVQFVNAVLASPQGHAAWTTAYNTWLAGPMSAQPQGQPTPDYGRGS
jgi:polar amino acid transport system substrate-binding protein